THILDKMNQYFSVCFAEKRVALASEVLAQRGIVFDDAVMDDGHFLGSGEVRVGIGVIGFTVGGPARMSDPDSAVEAAGCQRVFKIGDFTFFLLVVYSSCQPGY